jgi:phage gp36-like protein
MFITVDDLKGTIYGYQRDEITNGNNDITLQAIAAAESEVRSYISGNYKKEWKDGRLIYDVEAIMSATGSDRNALIVAHTATIAKFYLIELCNADVIYENAKERYDRAVSWLKQLAKGEISLPDLPLLNPPALDQDEQFPFAYGSRQKFNHE